MFVLTQIGCLLKKIENGKHIGISADYLKIIQENIQIPISLVPTKTWSESMEKGKNKECDIFLFTYANSHKEKLILILQNLIWIYR